MDLKSKPTQSPERGTLKPAYIYIAETKKGVIEQSLLLSGIIEMNKIEKICQ